SLPSLLTSPRRPTRFPYTTLFRSQAKLTGNAAPGAQLMNAISAGKPVPFFIKGSVDNPTFLPDVAGMARNVGLSTEPLMKKGTRSEEHTSELQSQSNLVCRLLLEK